MLVVDDEPLMCMTLEVTLSERFDVEVARSGAEAKTRLEVEPPVDAILCDLMMPVMSGPELHAWVVEHDPGLAKRMVFMSGGAYTADAHNFLENVRPLQVQKPFELDELFETIERVIAAAG